MMANRKYSVPFTTETIEIFEVEATSPAEAAKIASTRRLVGHAPTHHRVTKFNIGACKPTIEDDQPVLASVTPIKADDADDSAT